MSNPGPTDEWWSSMIRRAYVEQVSEAYVAWRDLMAARNLVAEVAAGVTHGPCDEAAPCCRCSYERAHKAWLAENAARVKAEARIARLIAAGDELAEAIVRDNIFYARTAGGNGRESVELLAWESAKRG